MGFGILALAAAAAWYGASFFGQSPDVARSADHKSTGDEIARQPAVRGDAPPNRQAESEAIFSVSRKLTGHNSPVLSVVFSPDGKRILSGARTVQ